MFERIFHVNDVIPVKMFSLQIWFINFASNIVVFSIAEGLKTEKT